tara:strand:- start:306 stop:1967 length:1662 start_codon:yes stop_codon:yes gene_type:complete
MWQSLLKQEVEPNLLSHGNVIKTVLGDRLYSKVSEIKELNNFLNQIAFSKSMYESWLASQDSDKFVDFLKTNINRVKESETRLLRFSEELGTTLIKNIQTSFDTFYEVPPKKEGREQQPGLAGLMAERKFKRVPDKLLEMAEQIANAVGELGSEELSTTEEQDLFVKILEQKPLLKLEMIKLLVSEEGQLTKNSEFFDYTLNETGRRFVKRPDEITPNSKGYKDYFRDVKKILMILRDSEEAVIRLVQFASRAYGVKTKIPIDIQTISGRGKQKLAQERERSKRISRNISSFQTSLVKIKALAESSPGSYPITNKRLRKEYEKVKDEMRKALSEILIKIKYEGEEGSELSEEDKERIKRTLERQNIRPDTFTTSELREKNREIEDITSDDRLNFMLITDQRYTKVIEEYESVLEKIVEERQREMQKTILLIEKLSDDLSGLGRKFEAGMTEEVSEIIEDFTTDFLDSLKEQLKTVKEEVSEVIDSLTDEKFKEEDKMEELLEELLEDKIEDPDFDVEDTRLLLKESEQLQNKIRILEKTLDFIRKEVAKRPEA